MLLKLDLISLKRLSAEKLHLVRSRFQSILSGNRLPCLVMDSFLNRADNYTNEKSDTTDKSIPNACHVPWWNEQKRSLNVLPLSSTPAYLYIVLIMKISSCLLVA